MQRVICIGTAVIDTVFAVERLPLAPGKNPSRSVRQVCGGLGANAAATVSALGGEGVLWSRVGDDLAGTRSCGSSPRGGSRPERSSACPVAPP